MGIIEQCECKYSHGSMWTHFCFNYLLTTVAVDSNKIKLFADDTRLFCLVDHDVHASFNKI